MVHSELVSVSWVWLSGLEGHSKSMNTIDDGNGDKSLAKVFYCRNSSLIEIATLAQSHHLTRQRRLAVLVDISYAKVRPLGVAQLAK